MGAAPHDAAPAKARAGSAEDRAARKVLARVEKQLERIAAREAELHAEMEANLTDYALLARVGAINVPIIYFSVRWWNTLHQGASVSLTAAPTMAQTMLTGMLLMALAAWCYTIAAAMHRVRSIMIEREAGAEWVQRLAASRD